MPGITLDDIAKDGATEQPTGAEMETLPELEFEQEQSQSRFNDLLSRILTAETGEGSVSDYMDHPMNFNGGKAMARVLRGLTGIVGNLKLAIIDIGLGVLEFSKERAKNNDVPGGGGFTS